jgi:hypothetical protein
MRWQLLLLLFIGSCASHESFNKDKDAEYLSQNMWQDLNEPVLWSFDFTKPEQEGAVFKEVFCDYTSTYNKQLGSRAMAPAELSDQGIRILDSAYQKQEYRMTLTPKSGVGKTLHKTLYCSSEITPADFKLKWSEGKEILILTSPKESLRLKRYIPMQQEEVLLAE